MFGFRRMQGKTHLNKGKSRELVDSGAIYRTPH